MHLPCLGVRCSVKKKDMYANYYVMTIYIYSFLFLKSYVL